MAAQNQGSVVLFWVPTLKEGAYNITFKSIFETFENNNLVYAIQNVPQFMLLSGTVLGYHSKEGAVHLERAVLCQKREAVVSQLVPKLK